MKNILHGLRVALCQMDVIPGQPRLNADYIIGQIVGAAKKGIDVFVVSELAVSGYLIQDLFENQRFLNEVFLQNERIREATRGLNIAVVFGSVVASPGAKNEDGRPRIHNAGLVAQHGEWKGFHFKHLLPNYRIFDDRRHFYPGKDLRPIAISTPRGELKLGVMVCEDMWYQDYSINPGLELVKAGAEILVNISASPWTWQKNDKRHRVVKELLGEHCHVPMIYVNNTGAQNTGKNFIVFDGSSTVYNAKGERVHQVDPYKEGTFELTLKKNLPVSKKPEPSDIEALFQAIVCGTRGALKLLPEHRRKVVIGLSGGIDSALVAAIYTYILGPENVFTVNMPSKFNSAKIKSVARKLAKNLGVSYQVISIQDIVDAIAKTDSKCIPGSLEYQNVQARCRMEVLALQAQLRKGVFTCNGNKTEFTYGYATLGGDLAGFLDNICDVYKREVYQLCHYMNTDIFQREVIPSECFKITPSAELVGTPQPDPFDYGNLDRFGYHDQLAKAFVEFRWDAEEVLREYAHGTLEKSFRLDHGTITRLFPSAKIFIADLERWWELWYGSYFKRNQAPPGVIVSRRGYGNDLRESQQAPCYTTVYQELKKELLNQ